MVIQRPDPQKCSKGSSKNIFKIFTFGQLYKPELTAILFRMDSVLCRKLFVCAIRQKLCIDLLITNLDTKKF